MSRIARCLSHLFVLFLFPALTLAQEAERGATCGRLHPELAEVAKSGLAFAKTPSSRYFPLPDREAKGPPGIPSGAFSRPAKMASIAARSTAARPSCEKMQEPT